MNMPDSLQVDTWNITYHHDDTIIETEGKMYDMMAVNEVKYIGFVVSSDAKNVKNIIARRNKSSNTIRNIISMISGLGT